jgi:4'-phosphopantetheinyl transferase
MNSNNPTDSINPTDSTNPSNSIKHMVPVWNTPPTHLLLPKKDVHIWRAVLDLPSSSLQEFKSKLSADERIKADRFRFERDRNRFIVSSGILKTILGYYIGTEPGEIRFCYENRGKPRLDDAFHDTGIHFNVCHSEGLALYIFTRDHKVGIDIERVRDFPEMVQIIEQFFSVREKMVFRRLPDSKKREAFFNCWTRKEAFIKAIGEGFFYPLNQFDVSFAPDEPSRLLTIEGDSEKVSQWLMGSIKPALGFTAAFAVQSHDWRLHFWQWPDQPIENKDPNGLLNTLTNSGNQS